MTGMEFAERVARRFDGLSIAISKEILDTFIEVAIEELVDGGEIKLRGIGNMKTITVKGGERYIGFGENGTVRYVPDHKKISFTPAPSLKEAINVGSE